jgi:DNA polymerase III sliding clamp (beta) subunit (PCNA family)
MMVNRQRLVELLKKVYPAVGGAIGCTDYQYFVFEGNRVQATNGRMLIDSSLKDSEGGEDTTLDLHCALLADPLLNLLQSLSGDTVDIEQKDKEVVIKSGHVKGVFAVVLGKTMLNRECSDSCDLSGLKESRLEGFLEIIEAGNFCGQVVSKDETYGPLCGIHIKEGKYVFGTDRYRLIAWALKNIEFPNITGTLHIKFINMLNKCAKEIEVVDWIPGNKLSVVLKDNTYISSSVLLGDYPDLLSLFPADEKEHCNLQFKDFAGITRHIDFLGNIASMDKVTKFEVDGLICKMTSMDPNLGTLEENFELISPVSKFEFSVNPTLLQGSSVTKDGMKFYPEDCVVFIGNDQQKYLINVVR